MLHCKFYKYFLFFFEDYVPRMHQKRTDFKTKIISWIFIMKITDFFTFFSNLKRFPIIKISNISQFHHKLHQKCINFISYPSTSAITWEFCKSNIIQISFGSVLSLNWIFEITNSLFIWVSCIHTHTYCLTLILLESLLFDRCYA